MTLMDVDIPVDRVRLETRLIHLMGGPLAGRYAGLLAFLCSPELNRENPDLMCMTIAEMVRSGNRAEAARAVRSTPIEYCWRFGGEHCQCCPVQRLREQMGREGASAA